MIQELKLIGTYVKKHIWQYIFGIAALFIVDRVNTLIPLLTGEITDGLAGGTLDMNGVWQIVLRMLLMGLTIAIGRFCWRFFLFGASRSIEKEMRNDLFGHLETLSMRYFNTHKTGDL
ncbi:MAG: ABC transporter ATP-binding protein, partial [Clostridia bacterium]|nr:ABC transporter ATP-binding protein [Clostridia bacterium]